MLRAAPNATHAQLYNEDDLQTAGSPLELRDWPRRMRWLWIDPAEGPIKTLSSCAHLRYLDLTLSTYVDVHAVVDSLPSSLEQLELRVVGSADAVKAWERLVEALTSAPTGVRLARLTHLTVAVLDWEPEAGVTTAEDRLRSACDARAIVLAVSKLKSDSSGSDDSDGSSRRSASSAGD